jgi:hypothetical protein
LPDAKAEQKRFLCRTHQWVAHFVAVLAHNVNCSAGAQAEAGISDGKLVAYMGAVRMVMLLQL